MFQLIVAVISIALVAALAIASIYYGGTAFSQSSLRANVVTLVNGGQQIAGAQALYRTDFGSGAVAAANLNQLTTPVNGVTYLASAPGISPIASGSWSLIEVGTAGEATHAYVPFASGTNATLVCGEVSKQAGTGAAQFFCSDNAGAAGTSGFAFKL